MIDLSLGRVERLLADLGNPERSLPRVIHVAGTNGKGSLVAFLKAICEAAGYVAHAYISPHLVRFAERISVAGRMLDDRTLVTLLEEVEAVNGGQPITFFEVTTAAAFLAFSRVKADVTLIETGLGGRFDATNVFARPALTAITPVSMDHMSYLGDTLGAIAFEKAGILKSGIRAVLGPQQPEALRVIEARAQEIGAPLLRHGIDWDARPARDGMVLRDGDREIALPTPVLPGPHQIMNAGHAALCARRLDGLAIGDDALARGLRTAVWPARMQRLRRGPLVDRLGPSWELWLDGGHNPAAAEVLAPIVAAWSDKPFYMIFGALGSRDPSGFLGPLRGFPAALYAVAIPGEATTLSAADGAAAAASLGYEAHEAASVAEALASIGKSSSVPGRVLICGSLYLAGAVLAENKTPPA